MRIVVKVGSSSLTSAVGGELDLARLAALVNALSARRSEGTEVVLVSSGAIAAGIGPLGMDTRPNDLARQQAAASVGQGVLLSAYDRAFGRHGHTIGLVLLTVDDITRRTSYTNAKRTFDSLLDLGVLPIVNENDTVATHEVRFGDNDRLAALVAQLVGADGLVLLTDVDALYTMSERGRYWYAKGYNPKAIVAMVPAALIPILCVIVPAWRGAANYAWFIGMALGFVIYAAINRKS